MIFMNIICIELRRTYRCRRSVVYSWPLLESKPAAEAWWNQPSSTRLGTWRRAIAFTVA